MKNHSPQNPLCPLNVKRCGVEGLTETKCVHVKCECHHDPENTECPRNKPEFAWDGTVPPSKCSCPQPTVKGEEHKCYFIERGDGVIGIDRLYCGCGKSIISPAPQTTEGEKPFVLDPLVKFAYEKLVGGIKLSATDIEVKPTPEAGKCAKHPGTKECDDKWCPYIFTFEWLRTKKAEWETKAREEEFAKYDKFREEDRTVWGNIIMEEARLQRTNEVVECVEEYFKGLIHIPDPQATKESLIAKLKETN